MLKREQLAQELTKRARATIPDISRREMDLSLGGNGSSERLGMISELIAAQTNSQGLQQQTIKIQNQIAKLTKELDAISVNKSKLVELERKYDIAEGIYKGIIAQINQTKINNFNSYPNVQLIDGPTLNPKPETPSKKLILLGGMMASMFGSVSLLLFLESSSPLLSPKDLMLVEYPILYSLAYLKQPYLIWDSILEQQSQQTLKGLGSEETFSAPGDPLSSYLSLNRDDGVGYSGQYDNAAEREFERLAMIFRSLVLNNRRVMITSATAGEGKTTITLGLAIALRKLGFRVLVVDGDLQRSTLSMHLGIVPEKREVAHLEIKPILNLGYGLDLIPTPSVPKDQTAQFFAKGNFEQYLDRVQAEGNYDYVLVDSSPVHLTNESMLMAPTIENVLFVVRPGKSDRNSVMNSLEQLELHKAQIQGLILNGVDSSLSSRYRYSYKPQLSQATVGEQAVESYDPNFN